MTTSSISTESCRNDAAGKMAVLFSGQRILALTAARDASLAPGLASDPIIDDEPLPVRKTSRILEDLARQARVKTESTNLENMARALVAMMTSSSLPNGEKDTPGSLPLYLDPQIGEKAQNLVLKLQTLAETQVQARSQSPGKDRGEDDRLQAWQDLLKIVLEITHGASLTEAVCHTLGEKTIEPSEDDSGKESRRGAKEKDFLNSVA